MSPGALRFPPWATVLTLLGVCVLCGLGTWQLQRLQWKNDIIRRLDAAYDGGTHAALDFAGMGENDFRYGGVEGTFMPAKAILLGPRTWNGRTGNDLIVPLKMKDATLLVDMGWTDAKLAQLPIYHVAGKTVRFEGLARAPHWNAFTPDNRPDQDLWYKPDIAGIAAAKNLENPLPFILYAETASYKFDAAFPNNERWHPYNQHLQYAVFWFTMAGILLVIFALRFRRR